MPTSELVERVARAIDPDPWIAKDNDSPDSANDPTRRVVSLSRAYAALNAHEDWLAEQGLVAVPKARPEEPTKPKARDLEHKPWRIGQINYE